MVKDTTVSIVGSIAITVKDVYRFSDILENEDAFAVAGDQKLKMVACHTLEMREIYRERIFAFMNFFID